LLLGAIGTALPVELSPAVTFCQNVRAHTLAIEAHLFAPIAWHPIRDGEPHAAALVKIIASVEVTPTIIWKAEAAPRLGIDSTVQPPAKGFQGCGDVQVFCVEPNGLVLLAILILFTGKAIREAQLLFAADEIMGSADAGIAQTIAVGWRGARVTGTQVLI
jgi:hypothetical protein